MCDIDDYEYVVDDDDEEEEEDENDDDKDIDFPDGGKRRKSIRSRILVLF